MRADRALASEFVRSHAADAASLLEGLPSADVGALFAELPPSVAAAGVRGLVAPVGAECLSSMSPRRAGSILAELPPDVAAGLLLRLEPEQREELLDRMSPKRAGPARQLLRHREGTAGALVDPRALSLAAETTAAQALERLKRASDRSEHYVWVVDRDDRLLGVVTLHQLMLAPPRIGLESIMDSAVARLAAATDSVTITRSDGWRHMTELPVVDERGRFLGTIGHETMKRLESSTTTASADPLPSLGLAFADLCWIGMTSIVGGLASATLRAGGRGDARAGGPDDG